MDENNNNVTTVETEESETSYYEGRPSLGSRIVRTGATIMIWEGIKFAGSKIMNKLGWKREKGEGKLIKKEKKSKETKEIKESNESED